MNLRRPTFNDRRMTQYMHGDGAFDRVLHIAHSEWHGIRQCVAYAPGQKLLIPAEHPLGANPDETEAAVKGIIREIERLGINRVVFQGYSENADQLLLRLKGAFGSELRCFAVNHVTVAQFEHKFEMWMLARLLMRRRFGLLSGIASVKQNFGCILEGFWPSVIINFAPNLPPDSFPKERAGRTIYIPLDVGWRKNMYTNYLSALRIEGVDRVKVANYPFGLESLVNLDRLVVVGYLRGHDLFAQMANCSMLLMATLAECQPMTQLEAMAVGTPVLTGPLRLQDFADDPLLELCTTSDLDDPVLLAAGAQRLFDATLSDPAGMQQMIRSHLQRRHELARSRYAEFLEL